MRRNANLTTIAPTGTLSLIADCSSGCEPYYSPVHTRENVGQKFTMVAKPILELARALQEKEEGVTNAT